MNVLITGGYGNLGSWLVRYFVEKNEKVTILSKNYKSFLQGYSHSCICVDIEDEEKTLSSLKSQMFDVVIHAASCNDQFLDNYPYKSLKINAWGTRNILNALKDNPPKHFIYLSTFHVYGKQSGIIEETTELAPQNDYALTHLFAEYYLKKYAMQNNFFYSIIRLTNSYGCPLDPFTSKWYLVLNDLIKMAFEKHAIELKTNGNASRDFIWMGTVCKVIYELSKLKPENEVYNLSEEKTYTIKEIAEMVKEVYELRYNKILPICLNPEDKTPVGKQLLVKSHKLKNKVKYEPNNQIKNETIKIFDLLEKIKTNDY